MDERKRRYLIHSISGVCKTWTSGTVVPGSYVGLNFAAMGVEASSIGVRAYVRAWVCGSGATGYSIGIGGFDVWPKCQKGGRGCGNMFEFECNMTAINGAGIGLTVSAVPSGPGVSYSYCVDKFILETDDVNPCYPDCNGYCIIFEWIGDRFEDIEEWWIDFGASAESWWVIGDEVKALCDLVSIPFREIKEFFYEIDVWCEKICGYACRALLWSEILAKINDTFVVLSYTTSQFVTWLYSSLQESINFEGLWDWINNADDWFDSKLSGFKDGLEDWIAEKFEAILDKVFKP